MKGRRILVVDDDEKLRGFITRGLSRAGFEPVAADSGTSAIAILRAQELDGVLCDLYMPGIDGLDVLRFSRTLASPPPFIVLTGFGSVSVAVEAMKHGAADFLEKPVRIEELHATIQAVLARSARAAPGAPRPAATEPPRGLVGSAWLAEFLDSLRRVAETDSTVLLEGETGTGKSAIAREIAKLSPRASCPFVELNCAAIPDTLMENELFGSVRGAYTGASGSQIGKVEMAETGTLFLDEVGELKNDVQAKLLQLLQDRRFMPLGGKTKQSDVRFIAATNRNLARDVEDGRFRADLYYRLNVVSLVIPPLRDRPDDVPLLIESFAQRISARLKAPAPAFEPDALAVLERYRWPGNVRELENLVERMAVMHPGKPITASLLGDRYRHEAARGAAPEPTPAAPQPSARKESGLFRPPALEVGPELSFKDAVRTYEASMITRALAEAQGNQTRAAKLLNMNRTTLIEKMKKLGIESDEDPPPET